MLVRSLLAMLLLVISKPGWAWGERGHDLVTQVAVRLVGSDFDTSGKLSEALLMKAHLLGHLSNVPDTVWRNKDKVGAAATKANGSTHYVDSDYIAAKPSAEVLL